ALARGLEDGVVGAGDHGGHEEWSTHGGAPALDEGGALALSALVVEGSEAGEGGDLLAGKVAEFGQEGDEGVGEDRSDALHRAQEGVLGGEAGIGGDQLGDAAVEDLDIGLEAGGAARVEPAEHLVVVPARLVSHGGELVEE